MYKTKKSQFGFSAVEALLVLLIIGVIGLVGWFVLKRHNKTSTTTSTTTPAVSTPKTTTKTTDSYASWKQFCSAAGGYCLKYPAEWALTNEQTPDPNIGSASIVSASKDVTVQYIPFVSGIGGGCDSNMCFFTADSIAALSAAPGLKLVKGVSEVRLDSSASVPMVAVMTDKTIGDYGLVVNKKVDVGFFYPAFNNPNKNTGNTQAFSIRFNSNFKDAEAARAWFSSDEAKTVDLIFKSFSVKTN